MPLSVEKTAPNYGFSVSKREDQAKIFIGELTNQENIAKGSPGPIYNYTDQIKFREVGQINH